MVTTRLGDMSQSFLLRNRSAHLRSEMDRLTNELTSGQVSDPKTVLAGNFSYLAELERDVRALDSFRIATAEATQFTSVAQTTLEQFQDVSETLARNLTTLAYSGLDDVVANASIDAANQLDTLVNLLNTNSAGRRVFAGTATQSAPLASSTTLLTELQNATAGATSASAVLAAADVWFASPAGFDATIYQGSTDYLAPMQIAEDTQVSMDIRADDPALKDVLKNVALAALATDPTLNLSDAERNELLRSSGESLLTSQQDQTVLRANLGATEARIETVTARNAAEATSLDFAKRALLAADPYETATRLEDVQFQLQSLYSATVRMSDLSLVNFLR